MFNNMLSLEYQDYFWILIFYIVKRRRGIHIAEFGDRNPFRHVRLSVCLRHVVHGAI